MMNGKHLESMNMRCYKMSNQSRFKAVTGQKYKVDGVEYIAVENISGCKGCVAENEKLPRKLCKSFPFC